jgi:hypothetical protein
LERTGGRRRNSRRGQYSAYNWVAFATAKFGIITGWNLPPRRTPPKFPDWMDPEDAINRRETPHLSYSLVTKDGGQTWKPNSASLFGDISRIRFGPEGKGLGLIEYSNSFRYPPRRTKSIGYRAKARRFIATASLRSATSG